MNTAAIAETLDQLSVISEALLTVTTVTPSIEENIEPPPQSIAIHGPTARTYIPLKSEPVKLPPRLDYLVYPEAGDNRASTSILKDSLMYYERARRTYESNQLAKAALLSTKDTLVDGEEPRRNTTIQSCENPSVPEGQGDQFLDFIEQILKQINKLLSKKNYGYDVDWMSMVQELDLDEGFFFLNMFKLHEGGELYQFLVSARKSFGECRLLESYRMCTQENLVKYRQACFGKFADYLDSVSWYTLLLKIKREKGHADGFTSELNDFRDELMQIRTQILGIGPSEDTQMPCKPNTPFIDDILKASYDTGLSQNFFLTEIKAQAEKEVCGKDFIVFCLEQQMLEILCIRLTEDLGSLKTIYLNHPDPMAYVKMKKRIESLRDLFFVLDEDSMQPNGEPAYCQVPSALKTAAHLLKVFNMKNEKEKLRCLEEVLEFATWSADMLAANAESDTEE
ncbi:hypothetical protein H072_9444 [Dactylellina haptotyla CBS 200.50]|uniref:Uncharacterized protein n=1 Tax=Dactylellina haptotyla (strain CBS 200.50) TaxID=1284197 RepID=S8BP51_DACHA|nr:hypothetical protein H072_9444 [Dactylellina haptotyla CBS 200.50]